jgi:dTDP-D-glucose 4,6-dehydratase
LVSSACVALGWRIVAGIDDRVAISVNSICPRLTSFRLVRRDGPHTVDQNLGSDYPTSDGTCIRDYVHVSDLADAHVCALDWLAKGNPSRSFNLGNGRGFSVAEVVKTTEEVTGLPVRAETCPRRSGDPPMLVSDSGRARELLGWTPKYPNLDQQIAHAWTWLHGLGASTSSRARRSGQDSKEIAWGPRVH